MADSPYDWAADLKAVKAKNDLKNLTGQYFVRPIADGPQVWCTLCAQSISTTTSNDFVDMLTDVTAHQKSTHSG